MMTEVKRTTLGKNGLSISAGTLMAYHYDAATGIFSGETEEYLPPGVGLPASSTATPPPDAVSGKVCVFISGVWQQVEDHRGETVYRTTDGMAIAVDSVGDYPAGTTTLAPATAFDVWNGKAWETDLQAQQAAAERAAEAEKAERIAQASSVLQMWQVQLMLGIITDEDKAALVKWMNYIQTLQVVDTSTAPDIRWPEKPV